MTNFPVFGPDETESNYPTSLAKSTKQGSKSGWANILRKMKMEESWHRRKRHGNAQRTSASHNMIQYDIGNMEVL
jgi:hypothetical protein